MKTIRASEQIPTQRTSEAQRPRGTRRAEPKRNRLVALLCFLTLCFATLAALPLGAGAQILDFELQPTGPFAGPLTEGEYEFTTTGGSVEFSCAGLLCGGEDGLFLASTSQSITISRTDGDPFSLTSLSIASFPVPLFLIQIDGTTASAGPVQTFFAPELNFTESVLPASFTDLLSVTISASSASSLLSIDNVAVVGPPLPSGTPGTMTLISDDRFVRSFGQDCDEFSCAPPFNVLTTPSAPFAPFDAPGNTQSSTAETGRLAGTASASGFSDIGYSITDSTYDVTFALTSRTRIQLIGTMMASQDQNFGFSSSEVVLRKGATILFQDAADPDTPEAPFDFDRELSAGVYRLTLQADGDVGMTGSFDFVLAADPAAPPVPSLAPSALLALGGILIAIGRRTLR